MQVGDWAVVNVARPVGGFARQSDGPAERMASGLGKHTGQNDTCHCHGYSSGMLHYVQETLEKVIEYGKPWIELSKGRGVPRRGMILYPTPQVLKTKRQALPWLDPRKRSNGYPCYLYSVSDVLVVDRWDTHHQRPQNAECCSGCMVPRLFNRSCTAAGLGGGGS